MTGTVIEETPESIDPSRMNALGTIVIKVRRIRCLGYRERKFTMPAILDGPLHEGSKKGGLARVTYASSRPRNLQH